MATDSLYWTTSLLLNFEDASSTTFTDISRNPKTPTVNGGAVNSAAQVKTGSKSLLLVSASSSYLEYAHHVDFELGGGSGGGDFCIECWWRPTTIGANQQILQHAKPTAPTGPDLGFGMRQSAANTIICYFYSGSDQKAVTSTTSMVAGTWYHLAWVRRAGAMTLYINGLADAVVTASVGDFAVNNPASSTLRVGRYDSANTYYANGHVDGLRITKGQARYTANFTTSTELFEASVAGTGSAAVTAPMFTGVGNGGGNVDAAMPMFTGVGYGGGRAEVEIPMFGIRAVGRNIENTAELTLPMFTGIARGSAVAAVRLPMFTGSATVTVPITVSANVNVPMFEILASGSAPVIASASVVLPMFTGQANGGGNVAVTVPMFGATASGAAGIIGTARVEIPMFDIEASATTGIVVRAEVVMPMIQSAPSARADVQIPMFGIVAIGRAVVTVTYEAYAVNLKPGNKAGVYPVTRYTNQPFSGMARWRGNWYGWGPGGLYLIGGDTDDGEPIAWAWKTAITNFGSRQEKRVPETFLHGRLGTTVSASVSIGEAADVTYAAVIERGRTAQAHRIKYGRGLKAEYWSFGLADVNGSAMEIDSMQHEPQPLSRKI